MIHRTFLLTRCLVALTLTSQSESQAGKNTTTGNEIIWVTGYPKKAVGGEPPTASCKFDVTPGTLWTPETLKVEIYVYENNDATGYDGKVAASFTDTFSGVHATVVTVASGKYAFYRNISCSFIKPLQPKDTVTEVDSTPVLTIR